MNGSDDFRPGNDIDVLVEFLAVVYRPVCPKSRANLVDPKGLGNFLLLTPSFVECAERYSVIQSAINESAWAIPEEGLHHL